MARENYSCFICSVNVPGPYSSLTAHFRDVHKSGKDKSFDLICGQGGCKYSCRNFSSFRNYLLVCLNFKNQPLHVIADLPQPMAVVTDAQPALQDPSFIPSPIAGPSNIDDPSPIDFDAFPDVFPTEECAETLNVSQPTVQDNLNPIVSGLGELYMSLRANHFVSHTVLNYIKEHVSSLILNLHAEDLQLWRIGKLDFCSPITGRNFN